MRSTFALVLAMVSACDRDLNVVDPKLVAVGMFEGADGATLELRSDGGFIWRRDRLDYRVDGFVQRVGRRVELVCPNGGSPELPTAYTCATANERQFLVPDHALPQFVLQLRANEGGEGEWLQRALPPDLVATDTRAVVPAPFDTLLTSRTCSVRVADWQGEFATRSVDYDVRVSIEGERFTWRSGGHLADEVRHHGLVEPIGPFIVLRPGPSSESDSTAPPIVLVPTRGSGCRILLFLEWATNYVNESNSRGDAAPILGLIDDSVGPIGHLEMPEPFAAWIRTEPLEARVITIEPPATEHSVVVVRVDVGSNDGAFPGMRLHPLAKGADDLELLEIGAHTSLGRERFDSDGRASEPNALYSSRKP
ncbi:MAG: hypothetical protein IT453_09860 [Planctomycetes bacterium]|nr:hypothetical protein [Planctomycetota bacterium]